VSNPQRKRQPSTGAAKLRNESKLGSSEADGRDPTDPRARLASRVNALMREEGMTQRAAAERLGLPQPKISAIKNYRLHGISLERLIAALVALDQSIVITVKHGKPSTGTSVKVITP
jgi:predicted XRE-type DNA-binding protein